MNNLKIKPSYINLILKYFAPECYRYRWINFKIMFDTYQNLLTSNLPFQIILNQSLSNNRNYINVVLVAFYLRNY